MAGFPVLHISRSLLRLMPIESVMLSNYIIHCCPLLLLPSIFRNITVFLNELALHIRMPSYSVFSFITSLSMRHCLSSDHYLWASSHFTACSQPTPNTHTHTHARTHTHTLSFSIHSKPSKRRSDLIPLM